MRSTVLTPLFGLAAAFAVVAGAPSAAQAADTTIGYVNLSRALLEVNEGQRAMKRIKGTFDKKQKELLDREQELKKMKDTLDAQSVVSKDDAANRAKRAEFETKVMELQQLLFKEQQELEKLKAQELSSIRDKMKGVIANVGKANGYTLILEIQESRLLYAKPHLDLTNEVIRKYNQKYK